MTHYFTVDQIDQAARRWFELDLKQQEPPLSVYDALVVNDFVAWLRDNEYKIKAGSILTPPCKAFLIRQLRRVLAELEAEG